MKTKINIILVGIIIISIMLLISLDNKGKNTDNKKEENVVNGNTVTANDENIFEIEIVGNTTEDEKNENVVKSAIELKDADGRGTNYTFEYKGEEYKAIYTIDNWHIENSYKIRDEQDITAICEALNKIYRVHGSDMKSYRTAEDMSYEWILHNLAYDLLPENNPWRESVKHVDLDPYDQGKNLWEMYEARVKENSNEN